MRLGLRMGLNSRQGGGGDLPSLDLAFALDKTLTARKGPTPAFTRVQATSTGSTYIGADKLINYAAANEPRFDHDPATGVCKGLLIEESRTNVGLQSENFGSATWVKAQASASVDTATSPSGSVTADTLIEDSTPSSLHFISQQTSKSASSITYAFSVYYKNSSGTRNLVLALTNGTSAGKAAIFTTSGSVAASNINIGSGAGFAMTSADVVNAGNGWYRAHVVISSDASIRLDAVIYLTNSSSSVSVYNGDGVSGLYLWGAQLEAGAFPTSYIPTTIGTAARSADVCSIIEADFSSFYNQVEGTFLSSSSQPIITTANALVYGVDNGSDSSRFHLNHNTSIAISQSGGVTQSLFDMIDPIGNELSKVAYAYKVNDYSAFRNATQGTSASNGTVPTVDRINFGSTPANLSRILNGHIARIQYFRKRLSNAKLQTLTAP